MWEDIYSTPEHYSLRLLYSMEVPDLSYEFDIIALWQTDNGKLYIGQDSGCSCPSPFEDYHSIEKLTPVRSVADAQKFVMTTGYHDPAWRTEDKLELYRRVREALSTQ